MTYNIIKVTNDTDKQLCFQVRLQVFHVEQGIPAELEFDSDDETCDHWLATDPSPSPSTTSPLPIGTARLIITSPPSSDSSPLIGKVGRVAVLPTHRHRGIARHLLLAIETHLLSLHSSNHSLQLHLHSQADKQNFYHKVGYVRLDPTSPPFMEDGIPHVKMVKYLTKPPTETEAITPTKLN